MIHVPSQHRKIRILNQSSTYPLHWPARNRTGIMERTTTPDTLISEARRLLKSNANLGAGVPDRDFRSHFGVSPTVCFMIWEKCKSSFLVHNVLPRHLLWALMFLKIYATEDVLSTIAAVSRKTYRFWTWIVLMIIAKKKNDVVSFLFQAKMISKFFFYLRPTQDSMGEPVSI
jgi:hypothetical protein